MAVMRNRLSRSARLAESCASCEWRWERCRALIAAAEDVVGCSAAVEGRAVFVVEGREGYDMFPVAPSPQGSLSIRAALRAGWT